MYHAEGEDSWEQFESAVEVADKELSEARDHYSAIKDFGGKLDAAYLEALDELEETVEEFDSVFDVSAEKLDAAIEAARQGELLSGLVLAHRRFHEHLVESRADLVSDRFSALKPIQKASSVDSETSIEDLTKRISAMNKLLEGEKHQQLITSNRISLVEIEEQIFEFDEDLQERASPEHYAYHTSELIHTLRSHYTNNLSWLNERDADRSAISVTDRIQRIPTLDDIDIDNPTTSSVNREEAGRIGEAAAAHYELALETSERRGEFELGEALCEVLREHTELEEETESELWELVRAFEIETVQTRIAGIIRTEAATSTSEQVLRILRQHNGSVEDTAVTLDISTDELFEVLQQLYEERTVTDLKVKFE